MTVCARLWLVVSLTGACFHAPSAPIDAQQNAPEQLEVGDPGGAWFPLTDAPREPRLRLTFAEPPPNDAAQSLVLLRGVLEPPLLRRLSSPRPSSQLKQRLLPVQTEPRGTTLLAQPLAGLLPGARYTVGWLTAAGALAFTLRVSDSPSQGARLAESWPGAGALHVPARLARALLRFDGFVTGPIAEHVALRSGAGEPVSARVSTEPCSAHGLPRGDCVWLAPSAPLHEGEDYTLALSTGLQSASGAPILPTELSFQVASRADDRPPAIVRPDCALDELESENLCLRVDERTLHVRGTVDEPALLTLASSDAVQTTATLSYADTFELALTLAPAARSAFLQATDLAGQSVSVALSFTLLSELATVSIDELRADPLGKEPAQEYVELLNYGSTPVSLMGFSLSKDMHAPGRKLSSGRSSDELTGASMLAPGERALLVAGDFDARDESDGALPGGIRLLYLDGALSLSNAGEHVFLRDAAGRRVSAATVLAALVEGQCSARFDSGEPGGALDPRSGDESAFELDPLGGCTPGSATFPRP